MDTNRFQPDPRDFDDVEGHGALSGRIDGPDTDDTEGHAACAGRVDGPDTDQVEGHGICSGRVDGTDTDDVDGHAIQSGRIDGTASEDAEGHVYRPMLDRLDSQAAAARGTSTVGKPETKDDGDDTEGHGIRGNG